MNFNALTVFTTIALLSVISSTDARPSSSGDGDLVIHHSKNFLGTPITYKLDTSEPGSCTQIQGRDQKKIESFKSKFSCIKLCKDVKCTECKTYHEPTEVKDLTKDVAHLKGNLVAFKTCNEKNVEEKIPTDSMEEEPENSKELVETLGYLFSLFGL